VKAANAIKTAPPRKVVRPRNERFMVNLIEGDSETMAMLSKSVREYQLIQGNHRAVGASAAVGENGQSAAGTKCRGAH
jgi:hypothetical protein